MESECQSDGECDVDESCIELGLELGACVKTCTYGFNGDTYEDTCVQRDGLPHDCHPLGINEEVGLSSSGRKRWLNNRGSWLRFHSTSMRTWQCLCELGLSSSVPR